MNSLTVFENPEFGPIRTVELDGEPWLVGKDVAEALGLSSTMLKSLVRRSVKMDYRGHRIELIREE